MFVSRSRLQGDWFFGACRRHQGRFALLGKLRQILTVALSVGMSHPAVCQSFSTLTEQSGRYYGAAVLGDHIVKACAPVPPGEVTGENGKKVWWSGVGEVLKWRDTCRRLDESTESQIRKLYPAYIAEHDRQLKGIAPIAEEQSRNLVRNNFVQMKDERLACYVLARALTETAAENCRP